MNSHPGSRTPTDVHATAVVCIECQNGVIGEEAVLPSLADAAGATVAVIGELLEIAREIGILVVHAPFLGPAGGNPGTAPLMRITAKRTAHWTEDGMETQVVAPLSAPSDVIVGRRHGFSASMGTELIPILRSHQIRTVLVAGVSLNVAIPVTVAHLAEEGFEVVVVPETVVGIPPEYGAQVLRNTIPMLAEVVPIADIEARWKDLGNTG